MALLSFLQVSGDNDDIQSYSLQILCLYQVSLLIFLGTAVGAGMIALPVETFNAGFIPVGLVRDTSLHLLGYVNPY